jgi:DNA invertase Pin-like site-specific DNA recombinase
MRIAIYARVSTDNKGQDPENQLRQLREWCASAGHELVQEYVDKESGRKGTKSRKQFAVLFEDAHRRKFDCVLFWALDRFTREGMVPTIMYLQRLASYGVGFHSYTEPHLATDNELVGGILLALLASLAKQEAKKISERTKAGLARARAQGKRLGRPGISDKLKAKIAKRIAEGETPYRVAKDLGIDRHTAQKYGAAPFREEGQAAAQEAAAELTNH